MPRSFLFGVTSVLALLMASPLSAKVFTFSELNCRCEVPDTWVYTDTSGELVDVVDIPRTKSFELLAVPTSREVTLDNKEFLAGFDNAAIPLGFAIQDRREVVLNGVKFHEVRLTKDLGNKSLNVCIYITLADGYGYNLRIKAYNVDPDQDVELKAMLQSFAFIKPPQTHTAFTIWDILTPQDASQHDATYLANYRAGVAISLIGILTILLTIAVGISYGFSLFDKDDEDSSSHVRASVSRQATTSSEPRIPLTSPKMKTIYILRNEGEHVTHDEGQVRKMLREGVLTLETYFWMEDMPEWRPLQELPPPRVTTVVPPRRTGNSSSSSSSISVQKLVRSPETTRPEIYTQPSAITLAESTESAYRFRFIHKVRFLRLAAAWIDLSLVFAPLIFLHFAGPYILTHDTGEARPNFAVFFCLGLYFIVLIVTQIVQALRSRSVGKSIFRLRVVNFETESKSGFAANIARLFTNGSFGLIPLALFCHLPIYILIWVILYAFIDAVVIFYNDRCIHDYLTGTTVIQRER